MQRYEKYKDSGIEWLGEIPEHWELSRLKHLFKEKKKVLNFSLPAGSISFGEVVFKDDEKIPESTKATYQEVLKGDYLINPLNLNYDLISLRIALSAIDVVVSSGYIVIQDVIQLNKNYYKWLLHQYDVSYMKLLGSGVRQTISFNNIANSELPYPNLDEQEVIANFLNEKCEKIDAAINLKELQIEKLKELRQIIIHDAVTKGISHFKGEIVPTKYSGIDWIGEIPKHWEVKRLKNVLNNKLKYGANESGIEYDKNLPRYIRISDFDYGGNLRESKKLSLPVNVAADYYLKDGDLLFARSGATVGKAYQFKLGLSDDKHYCFAGYLIKAEPNIKQVLSDFLYLYTQ
ncbi:restriction endonuclease subunit S [Sphingobacterium multivorum]|uniref:restriction endonuclease subunit S n=4 Tax=Sphingobacteriaceae TaxID=84566 RepID=UPI003DA4A95D